MKIIPVIVLFTSLLVALNISYSENFIPLGFNFGLGSSIIAAGLDAGYLEKIKPENGNDYMMGFYIDSLITFKDFRFSGGPRIVFPFGEYKFFMFGFDLGPAFSLKDNKMNVGFSMRAFLGFIALLTPYFRYTVIQSDNVYEFGVLITCPLELML